MLLVGSLVDGIVCCKLLLIGVVLCCDRLEYMLVVFVVAVCRCSTFLVEASLVASWTRRRSWPHVAGILLAAFA